MSDRTFTLYRLRDAAGTLLYVGISGSALARWLAHNRRPWWPDVAAVEVKHFPTLAEVRSAETTAIREEGPLYNIAGNPGAPRGVRRTFITPAPRVAPTPPRSRGPREAEDPLGYFVERWLDSAERHGADPATREERRPAAWRVAYAMNVTEDTRETG